jgi:hypothetical protein
MSLIIGKPADEAAKVFIRGIIHCVGPFYFERVVNTTKREMAKSGVFNWKPSLDNMLFEVGPAPEPWAGQWAFRLRCTHLMDDNSVQVCEFWLPESQLSLALADKLTDLH